MRLLHIVFIFFLLLGKSAGAQPSADTLYDQYPDIYIGPYVSADMDGLMFSYSYFDSLENNFVTGGNETRYLKTSLQGGVMLSTKYFGFSYAIPALGELFASGGATITKNSYKSFSVPLYFKSIYMKASYTSIQGMQSDDGAYGNDTTFSEFKNKRYTFQSTYYFNKKAPMGKLLSFLGMPTRNLSSWGLKSMFAYSTFTNNGYSFLKTGWDQNEQWLWNYAHTYAYFNFAIAPGFSKFIVSKKIKNGREKKLRVYVAGDIYMGPTFYWNEMKCVDQKNDAEKTGVGMYGILNARWGISTRRLMFESRFFLSGYNVKNERLNTTTISESILFTLGYRLSFVKGYAKIDSLKDKIRGK